MTNEIYPMVLVPNKGIKEKSTIFILRFPEMWLKKLKAIYQLVLNKNDIRLPIFSLNSVIEAFFPQVIKVQSNADNPGNVWIIGQHKLDSELLIQIMQSWINHEFYNRTKDASIKEQIKEFQKAMDSSFLSWERVEVNLYQEKLTDNGTPNLSTFYFDAIPEYICHKLCHSYIKLKFNNEELRFKRTKGNEIMSWPPLSYKDKNEKIWYYAIVTTVSVQTAPLYPEPLIMINLSTRRFISEPLKKLPPNRMSVLIQSNPYWAEEEEWFDFAKACIQYDPKSPNKVSWGQNIQNIIEDLSFSEVLPPLPELIHDPINWINPNGKRNALIVLSNSVPYHNHKVGTGIGMRDMRELMEQIPLLFPEFKKLGIPKRIKMNIEHNDLVEAKKIDKHKLRTSLCELLGRNMVIEVRYQNDVMKNEIKKAILSVFGIEDIAVDKSTYKTPELNLDIMFKNLGFIGDQLEGRDGHIQRIKEIGNTVEMSDVPIGCIVELQDKDFWDVYKDPKGAIRDGLAKRNRLVQFITPPSEKEDNLRHRAENAVWDLLRQFGYMPYSPNICIKKKTNYNFQLFGIWIVSKNRSNQRKGIKFPVVVHIEKDSGKVRVKHPFSNGWKLYRESLLDMAKNANNGGPNKFYMNPADISFFILKVVKEINLIDDALILAEAINIRGYWKWLQDRNAQMNNVWIDTDVNSVSLDKEKKTRIIRLRESNEETPMYYGMNLDKGCEGYASGLFKVSDNVFWSIAKKPVTMRGVRPEVSRLQQPDMNFKYPKIIEVAPVYYMPDDSTEDLAFVVHKMREMLSYFDESVDLPAPLHLAKKIEEYIYQIE